MSFTSVIFTLIGSAILIVPAVRLFRNTEISQFQMFLFLCGSLLILVSNILEFEKSHKNSGTKSPQADEISAISPGQDNRCVLNIHPAAVTTDRKVFSYDCRKMAVADGN